MKAPEWVSVSSVQLQDRICPALRSLGCTRYALRFGLSVAGLVSAGSPKGLPTRRRSAAASFHTSGSLINTRAVIFPPRCGPPVAPFRLQRDTCRRAACGSFGTQHADNRARQALRVLGSFATKALVRAPTQIKKRRTSCHANPYQRHRRYGTWILRKTA